MKNLTNIVEQAVKVEKRICKRIHTRSKQTEIKHVFLKTLAANLEYPLKMAGSSRYHSIGE